MTSKNHENIDRKFQVNKALESFLRENKKVLHVVVVNGVRRKRFRRVQGYGRPAPRTPENFQKVAK